MNQLITGADEAKLIKQELTDYYQAAKDTVSDKTFFLSIHSYVRYIHSNQSLETPVFNYIQSKHDVALKSFIELDQKLVNEIDSAYKTLVTYLDKNNVDDPLITDKRKRYEGYKDGSIDSDGGTAALRNQVDDILFELDKLDRDRHSKFLGKFGRFDPEHHFLDLNYLESERKWREEKNRIDKIKHVEIWFWWWELEEIYQLISRYEELAKEAMASNKVASMLGGAMRHQELTKLLNGDISASGLLNRDDYAIYLTQFHLEIQGFLTRLNLKATEASDPAPKATVQPRGFTVNSDDEVEYNGKPIELEPKQRAIAVLFIRKSQKPNPTVTHDEMISAYWDENDPMDEKYLDTHEHDELIHNLQDCVSKLRKIFQNKDGSNHIKTKPKIGYKFIA